MRYVVNLASRLLIICAVAGLCLAVTFGFTNPEIERQKAEAELEAFESLFPGISTFEEISYDEQAFARVTKVVKIMDDDGAIIGYNVGLNAKGYKGNIPLNVGFYPDGTLSGIRVGQNSETVGLGSKVGEPDYYSQYDNQMAPLTLGMDIIPISGATISSRGVLQGVNMAAEAFASLDL